MLAGITWGLCAFLFLFSTMANELTRCQSCGLTAATRSTLWFRLLPANAPKGLLCYRAGQEDSQQWAHAGLLAAADGSADLRANCQGTGFVVTEGADHKIILEFSGPVGGPVASLCSEAVGLL